MANFIGSLKRSKSMTLQPESDEKRLININHRNVAIKKLYRKMKKMKKINQKKIIKISKFLITQSSIPRRRSGGHISHQSFHRFGKRPFLLHFPVRQKRIKVTLEIAYFKNSRWPGFNVFAENRSNSQGSQEAKLSYRRY